MILYKMENLKKSPKNPIKKPYNQKLKYKYKFYFENF